MTSGEIRQGFLDFFRSKGHTVVGSDLIVPRNDPTLLFTGAGMNQFKEQFMGRNITYPRAASSQKCLRTGDLENVGRTPRHHTFFEMLGNFSFGDYFKKEAIAWAWEFMTREMGLPEEKLWVSVYQDDDEAYHIWLNEMKVPAEKIVRLGEHDNFWPADAPSKGPNGPCGPCSEIFYDQGEDAGCGREGCDPGCDCDRFLEVWNLVFTQFDRQPDGTLAPLPSKNIDTGMGLERIAAVMQGVLTNFETDLFLPINEKIREETGAVREEVPATDVYLIADHIRAAVFAIGDGVSPSNEKQGYVIRKLIRRAFLKSGKREPFLYRVVPTVTAVMKDAYPETAEKREHIAAIIEEEEKRFCDTLDSAIPVLEEMLASKPAKLGGDQIFKLVDTYGLPLDVIEEQADVPLDTEGFEKLMAERKEQSRKGSDIASEFIFEPDSFAEAPKPDYSEKLPLEAVLEFMLKEDGPAKTLSEGDKAEVITSPQSADLYTEAGGQVGDRGAISAGGAEMEIVNTVEADGRTVLQVIVRKGSFSLGDTVTIDVDAERKQRIACNHTATHLLQAALRAVLGDQVKQSGSMVNDRRLRFDFTHMKKLSDRELVRIEDMVNDWIEKGISVCKEVKPLDDAKKEGALSFFGEKYGDEVRVVTIGDESKELCGGTHVDNTGDIGLVKITGQSAVASGIRRIEAVSGDAAKEWIKEETGILLEKIRSLPGGETALSDEVCGKASDIAGGRAAVDRELVKEFDDKIAPSLKDIIKKLEKAEKKRQKEMSAGAFEKAKKALDAAAASPEKIGDIEFVSHVFEGMDMSVLRKAAGYLEKKTDKAVIFLGGSEGDKAFLICAVTAGPLSGGINAGELVGAVAGKIGGSGGGKDSFAQAGGKDPSGLRSAIKEAGDILRSRA